MTLLMFDYHPLGPFHLNLMQIATLAIPAVRQSVSHSQFVTHEIFSIWLDLIQYIV